MPEVRFLAMKPDGTVLGDLAAAESRKLEFHLDGPSTATFTLPGDHPDAALLSELATDVFVLRDGQAIFRGRVGNSADTIDANVHTVTFSATDYRGMLDRRIIWSDSPLSYRHVDQGQIAWRMINDTQNHRGGNLGIVQGTGTVTGIYRDRDYVPGKKIGEALTQLGDVINGFDWEIDAHLRFNVFYPYRGRKTGIDLVWGSQITGVQRNLDATNYATALRYSGDPGIPSVETAETTFPPEGRWEAQIGNPDLKLETSVQDAASATLSASAQLVPNYHCDLLPGWWDPAQLWLGDSCTLFLRTGRLDVAGETQRLIGMTIAYDDAGGEAVAIDLGDVPPSMTGRLGDYQSRIEVLERSLTAPAGYLLDAPVGSMFHWPGGTPPQTWVWADGAALATAAYPELFAIVGYTFGGAGGTFYLPDCRSRAIIGTGSGPGLSGRSQGQRGGAESVALAWNNNGNHGHGSVGGLTGFETAGHIHGTGGTSNSHTHSGTTMGDDRDHAHVWPAAGAAAVYNATANGLGTGPGLGFINVSNNVFTSGMTTGHLHGFATGGMDTDHTHQTGGESAYHQHQLSFTITPDGNGDPHENMPPWIAIGVIIRLLPPWRAGG
jgi:microcystin-dependent protein